MRKFISVGHLCPDGSKRKLPLYGGEYFVARLEMALQGMHIESAYEVENGINLLQTLPDGTKQPVLFLKTEGEVEENEIAISEENSNKYIEMMYLAHFLTR